MTTKVENITASYGYVRLSRDEDSNKESLENQKKILLDFAKQQNIELACIFEDDNVSGYTFERDGLNALKDLVEAKKVNTLIVKDLSRVGRHNAKTLVFLEFLREKGVRLLTATDNIDTTDSDGDMLIGIKTWYNELYVKDISKKIRSALRQRMKEGGLVIVPQFGYRENPEKEGDYIIDESAAITVRKIFELYLEGYGDRKIADYLNANIDKYPTPASYKKDKYKIGRPKGDKFAHLWADTSISRIIKNDVYIGTLRCGKTQRTMIKGGQRNVPPEQQIIYKNYFPPIISEETFEMAQRNRENRVSKHVRAGGNEKIHKYAGILECSTCGKPFVFQKKQYKGEDKIYYNYRCSTYHRYGRVQCTPHTISEDVLDKEIMKFLKNILETAKDNVIKIDKFIEEWNSKRRNYDKTIDSLNYQLSQLKNDIMSYSTQLARGKINEELFDVLTAKSKEEINRLEEQLSQIKQLQIINTEAKKGIQKSVDILESIIEGGEISNAHLNLLLNKIIVKDTGIILSKGNQELELIFKLNIPFRYHQVIEESIHKQTLP